MSETKFTKGEWFIGHSEDEWKALSIDVKCEHGLVEIASISGIEVDCREECVESTANANLIAAAPEMYAEIESEIEFLRELRSEAHTPYMAQLFDERMAGKEKLLAKARGEK